MPLLGIITSPKLLLLLVLATTAALLVPALTSQPKSCHRRSDTMVVGDDAGGNNCEAGGPASQELLPVLRRALPSVVSYTLSHDKVVQANAEGVLILARHRSSVPGEAPSRSKPTREGETDDGSDIEETELFLKSVVAASYTHKSWTDMRRTLVYLRTEVRFYNEIVPLLLAGAGENSALRDHLPTVYHAESNLRGLVPEDSPTTDATQTSPFPNGSSDDDSELRKHRLLQDKGGRILLQSLSPSRGFFQDSPLSPRRARSCLVAAAELHAAAWGNAPLLHTVRDRLSPAGGSYQLRLRNPNELRDMVASWASFRGQFAAAGAKDDNGRVEVLERDSVVRLGQRMYDMAEYVSSELTPLVEDAYATVVHGDFKAMNVFLPVDDGEERDGAAVMIDFSCAGVGLGMSDVAMHIVHAVLPEDLANGGEESLVEEYLSALENAMNRRREGSSEVGDDHPWTYSRSVALRHYRLACVDYLRFIMGRFWRSATPESFEKKKHSKNTTLINRNLEAALAFIDKVDRYLEAFEQEKREKEAGSDS